MKIQLLACCFLTCMLGTTSAQEMPSPSEEHKIIQMDVGKWTVAGKMLTPEGFQEFKADETVVPVGQFWTVSHFSADMFGGFKGSSTIGFDPKTKKFVGTWVDSLQPSPTKMIGTYDEKTKTMTYETSGIGMDGEPMPGKIIVHYENKDLHKFSMMHKDPTGQTEDFVATMEMTYTRKSD